MLAPKAMLELVDLIEKWMWNRSILSANTQIMRLEGCCLKTFYSWQAEEYQPILSWMSIMQRQDWYNLGSFFTPSFRLSTFFMESSIVEFSTFTSTIRIWLIGDAVKSLIATSLQPMAFLLECRIYTRKPLLMLIMNKAQQGDPPLSRASRREGDWCYSKTP